MIYTGMLIAGITAGYICLERHRPVEGILLLAGIAGSFAAISEQMWILGKIGSLLAILPLISCLKMYLDMERQVDRATNRDPCHHPVS